MSDVETNFFESFIFFIVLLCSEYLWLFPTILLLSITGLIFSNIKKIKPLKIISIIFMIISSIPALLTCLMLVSEFCDRFL